MDELKTAMNDHMDQMQEIVEKLSSELRIGLQPAMDNFIGFFHAIDWKEPWLVCLMLFHVMVLIIIFTSRKNINFQMSLFLLSCQNYFDRHGVFLSVLWSGPLLVFSMIILVNTLFSLCQLIVKWKRAELRHRARLSTTKQD
ncbi:transmembrane protein 18 isoform X2 [Cynara cardunculus var. scolymus]|uniref:transmembrane protein 18 isoform X2 n=1 Tax=Cynara cardunculus var. scolymus TaxID=59895 RepID=UPI000D628977|nr:transmembrane protein 18 isoform X2 [Cynara cardunculus var. scolymus]